MQNIAESYKKANEKPTSSPSTSHCVIHKTFCRACVVTSSFWTR